MIRQNFNENWRVERGKSSSIAALANKEEMQIIHLPHDAMIHEERSPDTQSGAQTGFYPGGEYIYTKTIEVPKEWVGKTITLEFEGVYQSAMVYINGVLAHTNIYGYSNFYVSLDSNLKYGQENTIKIIADNSSGSNSRWYSGSGIYRNVKLLVGERIHVPVDGVKITTLFASEESAIVEVETEIHNTTRLKETVTAVVTFRRNDEIVAIDRQKVTMFPEAKEVSRHSICIRNPKLWDCDSPNLYECNVSIESGDEKLDRVRENFGIRTLTLDSHYGLRINGKEVKLRGACIHHDNGIIGATTLERAEERRCEQLKEAGFNSIRSSHHPISKAMLDACDRIGILIMDELSDVWTIHKNPHDFALHFTELWEQEVERMVAKNYNHPSVIFYSAGNEIQEVGLDSGARMNRHICNKFHELDPTRYTTNGINGLTAVAHNSTIGQIIQDISLVTQNQDEEKDKKDGSNALNTFMSLMTGKKGDAFSIHPLMSATLEECSLSGDVIGLNYLTARHELEKELYPNKTVVGTETYPADIVRLWGIVKRNSHVLGDYTWAGYDYLGEAGCGIFHYDGNENFSSIYPERIAYIGDIDLIGCRRPISYLREIVFGLRKKPYLAVERVDKYGMVHSKTAWMYKDNIASWTWPGYEGKPAVVDIYADAQEVELFLNGKSLGRKPSGEKYEFTATYEITYEPGELMAVSYDDGTEVGRITLASAEEKVEFKVEVDRISLKADGEDLAFVTVGLVDKEGINNLFISKEVTICVEGAGSLQGFGSAEPVGLGSYDDTTWETYDGYVMAVIRAGTKPGIIKVTFNAEGCQEQTITIEVK